MLPRDNPVEFADRKARLRPILTALLAVYFAVSQYAIYPHFGTGERRAYSVGWAIQAVVMLLLLQPIVGFIWGRRVRELINDDVVQLNLRLALVRGFWLAMAVALGIFLLPASAGWSARQAVYFLVTITVTVTMLVFAWLDSRAHRHG